MQRVITMMMMMVMVMMMVMCVVMGDNDAKHVMLMVKG
jgi:hypothetical protein